MTTNEEDNEHKLLVAEIRKNTNEKLDKLIKEYQRIANHDLDNDYEEFEEDYEISIHTLSMLYALRKYVNSEHFLMGRQSILSNSDFIISNYYLKWMLDNINLVNEYQYEFEEHMDWYIGCMGEMMSDKWVANNIVWNISNQIMYGESDITH